VIIGILQVILPQRRPVIGIEIDAFNATAHEIAHDRGCAFVDVTGLSRRAGDADDMLVADRLHPSAAQYATWTDAILVAARQALAPARR